MSSFSYDMANLHCWKAPDEIYQIPCQIIHSIESQYDLLSIEQQNIIKFDSTNSDDFNELL